jgi:hypothetical protein
MNSENGILDSIDPDVAARLVARPDLLHDSRLKLGALATAPVLLAAVSTQAFGQDLPANVVDVLNFALTLEYLEDEFYRNGLEQNGLLPANYRNVFETIAKNEGEHVAFLKSALGSAAIAKPDFDLTAGGKHPDVLDNYKTFLAVAQAFEDTGVSAYKGQAPALQGNGDLLAAALRIHSVEARHAAAIRLCRGETPWLGAFDKPLTKPEVLAIAKPFIRG